MCQAAPRWVDGGERNGMWQVAGWKGLGRGVVDGTGKRARLPDSTPSDDVGARHVFRRKLSSQGVGLRPATRGFKYAPRRIRRASVTCAARATAAGRSRADSTVPFGARLASRWTSHPRIASLEWAGGVVPVAVERNATFSGVGLRLGSRRRVMHATVSHGRYECRCRLPKVVDPDPSGLGVRHARNAPHEPAISCVGNV